MSEFTVLAGADQVCLLLDPVTARALAQLMDDADLAGTDTPWIRAVRAGADEADALAGRTPARQAAPPTRHLQIVGGDPS